MKTHSFTLPNALRTILIDTGGAESATVLLLVGAGSRYENAKNNGIAHFFEHMAFKGSVKYPDSFTISSTIDGMGGVFNAFTSKDHTGYWIKGTADKTGLMLDVLSDMIISAKLDKDEIEKEKGVIVEEINMYEDMPQHKVSQVYDTVLYPNHPLGMDIAGTHDTVKSFDRGVFVDYIRKLYHPDNAVLIVSGGIADKIKAIRDEVANTFGHWDNSSGALKQYDFENFQEVDGKKKYTLFKKDTEQAHFVMGYTTDYGFLDDQKYVLGVLAGILGGGMSSRLFVEIREKRGLCYYVHTSRDMYAETGSLVTSAGVRCDVKTVNEALKLIVEEHENIALGKDKDKLADEIIRVKEMLKGRFLLSLEDSQSVASFYGNKMLLEGKYIEPKEVVQKILDVTIDDVISEAENVIKDDKLRLAVIGPFDETKIKI
ncbi:MAG: pitrilysin family protein [Patescibacteria group bacterium]